MRGSKGSKVTYCGVGKATDGDLLIMLHLSAILRRVCSPPCQNGKRQSHSLSLTWPKAKKSGLGLTVLRERRNKKLGLI